MNNQHENGGYLSSLHQILDRSAARVPGKTAVITEAGKLSYGELVDRSKRLAAWFRANGIKRGDRIALLLPNGLEAVMALMAASRIGAIFFVVSTATKRYHLEHILSDAEPALIITTRSRGVDVDVARYARVLEIEDGWDDALSADPLMDPFPGTPCDTACLIYTSGSTGKPKAVISSHRNMLFAAWAIQERLQIIESDVVGAFLPISFDYGLYQIFLSFQAGATLALGGEQHAGPALLKTLEAWKVTALPLVPNMASMLIRLARRTPSQLHVLRMITNTGAHLPRAYIDEMQTLWPDSRIYVMFGLTECKRVSIMLPEEYAAKSDSVGRPLPLTECVIVDADGKPVPYGEIGELVVRGPHVMPGYWRAPELTAHRFRAWDDGLETALFTGDQASMDADGFLYFHGRNDDVFKQHGFRVSATEIEAAACDVPGVNQACLVVPSDSYGSSLFVTASITDEVLREELRERLEDYKMPAQVFIVDHFPLTVNGKTDKNELKSYLMGAGKS